MLVGAVSGMALQLGVLAQRPEAASLSPLAFWGSVLLAALLLAAAFLALARAEARWLGRHGVSPEAVDGFRRANAWSFTPFLLLLLGATGVSILPLFALAAVLSLGWKAALWPRARGVHRPSAAPRPTTLAGLFVLSGLAALVYQIVWQRVLFAAFGLDPLSVTVIVAIFMLGLGLGALLGGALSARLPHRLPQLFFACEAATAAFALPSIPLIHRVAAMFAGASVTQMTLVVFLLLLTPTLLMGATLPILVTFLHQAYGHLGRTVGLLYAANTLGSALACFLTTEVLFVYLGQQGVVWFAAACNLAVGSLVLLTYGRARSRSAGAEAAAFAPSATALALSASAGPARLWSVALAVSAAMGFVALSQEMLWIRLLSYAQGSRAQVFGHVLGMFLLGVAAGALLLPRLEERFRMGPLRLIAAALLASGLVYFLALPLSARWMSASPGAGTLAAYLSVTVVAGLSGGVFPLLCDYAAASADAVGWRTSWIYMANILGSTAGPLVTGFWLLDVYPVESLLVGFSIATVAMAASVFLLSGSGGATRPAGLALSAAATLAMALSAEPLHHHLLERLHLKVSYSPARAYRHVAFSRGGIVAVVPDPGGDLVYGSAVFDGRFSMDPVKDSAGIQRAHAISLLHEAPRDVLEIGLASGSWNAALLADPRVRRLTVVELNPAYLQLIRHYPVQAKALEDPRLELVIDDGRRYLTRHPDARFDLVVMNTAVHWRSLATVLLSREFLEMCRARLKPGGVVYYNASGFEGNFFTAAAVFPHVSRIENFVIASERPIGLAKQARRPVLESLRIGSEPVFDPSHQAATAVLEKLLRLELPELGDAYRTRRDLLVITDDNMAPEFKEEVPSLSLPSLRVPEWSWGAILARRRALSQ
jgi:predicted membrane-bound spermidine synthase